MKILGLERLQHTLSLLVEQIFSNQKVFLDYVVKNYDLLSYHRRLQCLD